MSLIADSLKKAIKEKSFNVTPGINLLKNLGSQTKPKVDPKEVKRFVILIVIPATILAYLLLASPFDPNKNPQPVPPVVAKAPPVTHVPKPVPSQPSPTPIQDTAPAKEPDNAPVIEPGMTEVTVPENDEEELNPKPVPGPKKKSTKNMMQEPALIPEKSAVKVPAKKSTTKTEPSIKIKLEDLEKAPETPVNTSTPKTRALPPPVTPGPDIQKNSDHYFNRAIFYQQSRNWDKALTN
ncbi:MAG: hypothetical protein H8E42_13810 [Nitrospinae bacterium]|nr:hypothetical protein [Nitrospinota bacterium]MBL7021222.1 hypothetical protein [Nitrospinaceae bacterium]